MPICQTVKTSLVNDHASDLIHAFYPLQRNLQINGTSIAMSIFLEQDERINHLQVSTYFQHNSYIDV